MNRTVHQITFIRGDGIGPELAAVTARVLEATGVPLQWDWQDAGLESFKRTGEPLPDAVIDSIRRTRVAMKAPMTTPVGTGYRSPNVRLRQDLECFANIRPAKLYPGVPSKFSTVDIVTIRENMEDLYAGIEFDAGSDGANKLRTLLQSEQGSVISHDSSIGIKVISEHRSRAIAELAFEYARAHHRKKVTIVHKANIMKYTDGLFLETARAVSKAYTDISCTDEHVDALGMHLLRAPDQYDILLCPNLYGDILSDICAQLAGGLGVAPAANVGGTYAVFEAVHGSAPRYAGQNKVNPTALILAGVMMLRHIGETEAADRLEHAVAAVLHEGTHVTYDLLSPELHARAVGTREMGERIINALHSG